MIVISLPVVVRQCGLALAMLVAVNGIAADTIEAVQRTALEVARLHEETLRLRHDWDSEHRLLESTATALRERTRALETQLTLEETKISGIRRETDAVTRQGEALAAQVAAADARLRLLADRLVRLRPWLPPRLAQALELSTRSLMNPDLPLSERAQLTGVILNRCTQFNGAVTYSEETLLAPGSTGERLVEVLYWGLAQAFALDRAAGQAFVGRPGAKGWEWSPLPDGAEKVAQAIAIHRDKKDPEVVFLPLRLIDVQPDIPAS